MQTNGILSNILVAADLLRAKINSAQTDSDFFPFCLAVRRSWWILDIAVQMIPQAALVDFPAACDRDLVGSLSQPFSYYRAGTQEEIRFVKSVYDTTDIFLQIFHMKATQSRKQSLRLMRLEKQFIAAVNAL